MNNAMTSQTQKALNNFSLIQDICEELYWSRGSVCPTIRELSFAIVETAENILDAMGIAPPSYLSPVIKKSTITEGETWANNEWPVDDEWFV